MSRFDDLFVRLDDQAGEGAFVPFIMLSDPDPEACFQIISTAIEAGADALELGLPFSDPVADGPTVAESHLRALDGGSTIDGALAQIRRVRAAFPEIPIGMLIYGNVPFTRGLDRFYQEFAEAGVDSILIPDVPVREGAPFTAAAVEAGIDPIYIAPANASEQTLEGVSAASKGYIYAISRDGVTGTERESSTEGLAAVVDNIKKFGGAPILLGFGISSPQHVADAITAGASGAITGSAITKIIASHCEGEHPHPSKVRDMDSLKKDLTDFVSAMKAATKKA
ncbi:tryptophan synthase subunit alpha [Corynebacterium crudilactis]|uniref:Tryptophan synthase alpha chain n=1 Tax=Corynebacterium crudilactis TaxID=1652495 RepID=A0A172QWX3_9CORY|nr:tryptophan synthase subunit alpha [Corynebacterium crudilactis]ANE05151.1 tryptophan synthase subunit alpha [Corynebacterium crudilactis]